MTYKIAIASSDGKVVNQHFGRADRFYIVELNDNCEYKLVECRNVTPVCNGGNHDEALLVNNAKELLDCDYMLVSRIGPVAESVLNQTGIIVYTISDFIEEAIKKLVSQIKIQQLMNEFVKSNTYSNF